jgi:hypothetical protein
MQAQAPITERVITSLSPWNSQKKTVSRVRISPNETKNLFLSSGATFRGAAGIWLTVFELGFGNMPRKERFSDAEGKRNRQQSRTKTANWSTFAPWVRFLLPFCYPTA